MQNQVIGKLETRVSKKTNNQYVCLVIKLTPTYEKVVFLDKAEVELITTKNK